jgi:hypothetical protein
MTVKFEFVTIITTITTTTTITITITVTITTTTIATVAISTTIIASFKQSVICYCYLLSTILNADEAITVITLLYSTATTITTITLKVFMLSITDPFNVVERFQGF